MTISGFELAPQYCVHCQKELVGADARFYNSHKHCRKIATEMHAAKLAQQGIVDKDEKTKWMREHPDLRGPNNISWNEMKAQEEQARKDTEAQAIVDRAERKRLLAWKESELNILRKMVDQDEIDEAKEKEEAKMNDDETRIR